VRHAFEGSGIHIEQLEGDFPEIQAATSLEIARYTAVVTSKQVGAPVMREDNSIFLPGLGGLPGPFMAYVEKWVSPELLVSLLENRDRSGYFEAAAVLAYPDGATIERVHRVHFTVATEPRGELQMGWNRIIVLHGEDRTLAEYPEAKRTHIWATNYLEIRKALEQAS
jgi:inosine/xanthosine triphosphate pyrophosphatase family protein